MTDPGPLVRELFTALDSGDMGAGADALDALWDWLAEWREAQPEPDLDEAAA